MNKPKVEVLTKRKMIEMMLGGIKEALNEGEDVLRQAQKMKGYYQGYQYWVKRTEQAAKDRLWNEQTWDEQSCRITEALNEQR